LVQYQNALLTEKQAKSPFMVEGPTPDKNHMMIDKPVLTYKAGLKAANGASRTMGPLQQSQSTTTILKPPGSQ
jgi:hypothetical protein